MEIKRSKNYIEINGSDENGEFKIKILNDCSQMQMETEDNESYVNLNYRQLKQIRDSITEVLECFTEA